MSQATTVTLTPDSIRAGMQLVFLKTFSIFKNTNRSNTSLFFFLIEDTGFRQRRNLHIGCHSIVIEIVIFNITFFINIYTT